MSAAPRVRRVVVKVGSAVVAPGGLLDADAIARIAAELTALRKTGVEVVLVSSGAVALGFRTLGLPAMPGVIRQKQAAAAIGQPMLMRTYAEQLAASEIPVAQVLLTSDDFGHRERFLNARHTLETLLASGVLPIVNENDSVVFDEIKLGDNDRLSALVASSIDADLLLLLSVAPGLMDLASGRVLEAVDRIEDARALVDTAQSSGVGTGGMGTKLDAASIVTSRGIPAHLARGPTYDIPDPIARVLRGDTIGTRFPADGASRRTSRKDWIANATRTQGVIVVDDGAAIALRQRGASLLPGGIVRVEGRFEAGSAVEIQNTQGACFARGLTSYGSAEIQRIKGLRSDAIEETLGYAYAEEVIHRDDLHVKEDS
jgi:glutamate 5-kinase